jgi:predicted transposase YbfD/YdcC
MRCIFKKTVEAAIETSNHLILQLKANQPTLLDKIHAYCTHHAPDDTAYSCDIGKRSRIEQRHIRFWSLPAGIGSESWHDHFKAVIQVTRHVECFNTRTKSWEARQEQPSYYLATFVESAQSFGQMIRAHWGVENCLHHVLDTAFLEDASRIRCNPGIFSLIRHFSLNLMRYNRCTNIKSALYENALNLDNLLAYKGI